MATFACLTGYYFLTGLILDRDREALLQSRSHFEKCQGDRFFWLLTGQAIALVCS